MFQNFQCFFFFNGILKITNSWVLTERAVSVQFYTTRDCSRGKVRLSQLFVHCAPARQKATVLNERGKRTEAPLRIHKIRQRMARAVAASGEATSMFASARHVLIDRAFASRGCSLSQYPANRKKKEESLDLKQFKIFGFCK